MPGCSIPARGRSPPPARPLTLGRPLRRRAGDSVTLALRPEAIQPGRAEGREIVLQATARAVEFLGSVIRIRAEAQGLTILLDTFNRPDAPPPAPGETIEISFSARDIIVIGEAA